MNLSNTTKPSVFIGSSTESLDIAKAIHGNLDRTADPCTWVNEVFTPSSFPVDALLSTLQLKDFAVFVCAGDDITETRQETYATPRDNVIFELGMAFGCLGRNRVFLVVERDSSSFLLPSDLDGIKTLDYPSRPDNDWGNALLPACTEIEKIMKQEGRRVAIQNNSTNLQHTPKEELLIVSDDKTMFSHSTRAEAGMAQHPAVITTNVHWASFDQLPSLAGSHWIADRAEITEKEAWEGGDYSFFREFSLLDFNRIESAVLRLAVDDKAEVTVNGIRLSGTDPSKVTEFEIASALKAGINRIEFSIHNVPGTDLEGFKQTQNPVRDNPYGVRYVLKVTYEPRAAASGVEKPRTNPPFELQLGPKRPVANLTSGTLLLHVHARLLHSGKDVKIRSGSVKIDGGSSSFELTGRVMSLDSIEENFPQGPVSKPLHKLGDDEQVWLTFKGPGTIAERNLLSYSHYNLMLIFQTDHGTVSFEQLNTFVDLRN